MLSKKNPEDIAPNIKYFKPASELLIELLFLAININIEKVCNSRPKYSNIKLSDSISIIDPIKTRIKRQLISKVFSSTNSIIIKKEIKIKPKNIIFHRLKSNRLEFHKPLL